MDIEFKSLESIKNIISLQKEINEICSKTVYNMLVDPINKTVLQEKALNAIENIKHECDLTIKSIKID